MTDKRTNGQTNERTPSLLEVPPASQSRLKTYEYGQDVNNEAHSKEIYETYIMNEDKYLEKIIT